MSDLETLRVGLDTIWVTLTAGLIFFMTVGFSFLESGFCQTKNLVSVLTKNLSVYGISFLAFWSIGFALQFANGNDLFGYSGFFLIGADNSPLTNKLYSGIYNSIAWAGVPLQTKFIFQLGFAATTATIISGAVAERIKLVNYLIFCFVFVAFIYPLIGHWVWGGGWLNKLGFYDFAGSCVVHVTGGTAALTGAYILGARKGRYQTRRINPFSPHSYSNATLGCGILWLGWWGFNSGSTMSGTAYSEIATITLNTNLAAAMGGLAALLLDWSRTGKPDLTQLINGILSGLVAITASCAYVNTGSAFLIGIVGGILVVFGGEWLNDRKVDDPVGAVPVHLFAGAWGTLALGLFAQSPISSSAPQAGLLNGGGSYQLGIQLMGLITVFSFAGIASSLLWFGLKSLLGLRVSKNDEAEGLDISQHGLTGVKDE